jgi:DNA polymerase III epsilon subunit-like protein
MDNFTAIDFETGNPQRVSACAIGYAVVEDGEIKVTGSHLIKPVGGHAPFQTKIHGITEDQTRDQPNFIELFPKIDYIFKYPIVGHSQFDSQVLRALSDHFNLNIHFEYSDSSSMVKTKYPELKNYKLGTVAKYLGLPKFEHHDALEDAKTCARIVLKLGDEIKCLKKIDDSSSKMEYRGILLGIMADDQINFKEAFSLLYWLEDHMEVAKEHSALYKALVDFCKDMELDNNEEAILIKIINDELLQ